jgi:hypothetical protein
MSVQNNTPPPPDVELKFQMHAMTKMMERMNLMMGNVCDRLEKVGKHGNVAGTCTQEVRKVEAQHKSNNGSGVEFDLVWIVSACLGLINTLFSVGLFELSYGLFNLRFWVSFEWTSYKST